MRLLLLERQRWDRGGIVLRAGDGPAGAQLGHSGCAEWFLALSERHDGPDNALAATRFEDGVVELQRLQTPDLVAIVRRVAELRAGDVALSDHEIGQQLRHIDQAGRPLFAYFLGLALVDAPAQGRASGCDWTRSSVLEECLQRDQLSRWARALGGYPPAIGEGSLSERLAVVATVIGGLDCLSAERGKLLPHADAQTRREALVLNGGALGATLEGTSKRIPPLQPDLLGEWMVLRSLESTAAVAETIDACWRLAPDPTAAFLSRLSQDFPDHPLTGQFLGCPPPDGEPSYALARVASAIVVNLYKGKEGWPSVVTQALARAAGDGDKRSMTSLAYCYWAGQGVERDLAEAAAWYRKGADAGDGRAMVYLGLCYEQGQGVERDLAEAAAWYRKGADAGDGRAMVYLGLCYEQGQGVERDLAEAAAWYRKGADAGDGRAMAYLGLCYEQGQGVERDLAEAAAWYRKGADAGDGRAMVYLGFCYKQGQGVERDLAEAAAWYRKGADAGDGRAMAYLGLCYEQAQGVERDLAEAAAWYRKGADAGDGRAMVYLGLCYEQGQGVERDLAEAAAWYRKGADAGDGRAMAYLGLCYEQGQGVERDLAEAAAWYRKGADAGDGRAMVYLGFCYKQGQGVERDLAEAAAWYRKGADAGDGRAMAYLGLCYEQGQGVERDLAEAAAWYRKGADAGDGRAMAYLGLCYEQAQGVERDLAEAAAWYRKGADAGDGRAMVYLGDCYYQGQGVERDLAEAAAWYRKGADAGDETAASSARRVAAIQELLSDIDPTDDLLSRATDLSAGLGQVPWVDGPPMPGDWRDVSGRESVGVLAKILRASCLALSEEEMASWSIHRLRILPLVFYRHCSLVDIQLQRSGRDHPELMTALMADLGGIALLDGTSNLIHALNPDLICVDDDLAAVAYLRFFCQFVRGEDGPFQIVEDLADLAMADADLATLSPQVLAIIRPVQRLSDGEPNVDVRRFQACVQYSNAIFRSMFKVWRSGLIEMEDDETIAADLPVHRRQFAHFYRTPIREVKP